MATEAPSIPVNGNYAPHQGYGGIEQGNSYAYTTNAVAAPSGGNQAPQTSTTPAASSSAPPTDIPKDEVGWYFVEQYYTTLSRSPEKLYLFYNKRSQFVSGQETDKVQVCVGQRAINERIKDLDFQDCKVRVTNVDSQASDSNIVIQVIGEISNKGLPHKKFTQTFVLATQTNGYFVLNDIFRYLNEEEFEPEAEAEPTEEVQQEPAAEGGYQEPPPTSTEVEPKTLTSSIDPVAVEHDAQQVDREIENKVLSEHPSQGEAVDEPTVNGIDEPESEARAEDAPAAALDVPAQAPAPEPAQLAVQEPEQPREPQPTPSPPKQATPPPAPAQSKPTAPKTWASMAASANRTVATPAAVPPATMPAVSQSRPTPPKTSTPPASATAANAPPTAPAAQRDESPIDAGQGDEWTAVGGHNRQQSRQVGAGGQQQEGGPITRAYIKNVHEGIGAEELRTELEQYGEIVYFDIHRQKNAAHVEFKYPESYNAAVAANPHNVGGERLNVEERRTYTQRGGFQGGRGRGSGNQGQQRGNFQGGRGGYQPRGRGNTSAPRGRGGSAQAV